VKFGPVTLEISMWNRTHLKRIFRKNISAPRGCCTPKFLHALENDQVLLVHLPLGTEAPLQLFSKGSQKLAWQISLESMKIATKSKWRWRERSFGRWTKKILWNSVHYEQSYVLMLTYPKSHFSEDHDSAPRGCCVPKFLHTLEND